MSYKEKKLYKKAHEVGYTISKGKVHYLSSDYPVYSDEVGYNVIDERTGVTVWGCYNNVFDHLWSLSDVEDFLKSEYESLGLAF